MIRDRENDIVYSGGSNLLMSLSTTVEITEAQLEQNTMYTLSITVNTSLGITTNVTSFSKLTALSLGIEVLILRAEDVRDVA